MDKLEVVGKSTICALLEDPDNLMNLGATSRCWHHYVHEQVVPGCVIVHGDSFQRFQWGLTSRHFKQVAAIIKHIQRYQRLKLLRFHPLPADLWNGATALRTLSIKFSTLDDLPALPPNLVRISLNNVTLRSPQSTEPLASASSLLELSLESVGALPRLQLPPSLTSLRLCYLDQLLEVPQFPPTLVEIIIERCSLPLDPTFLPPSLKSLNWTDSYSFDPFHPVSHLTNLTSLSLDTGGGSVAIPCISQMQQLCSLESWGRLQCPPSLTSLSTLTSISINFKENSPMPLADIKLQLLLSLRQATFVSAVPPCAYDCTQLTSLILHEMCQPLKDVISKLTALKWFGISYDELTDEEDNVGYKITKQRKSTEKKSKGLSCNAVLEQIKNRM